MFYQYKNDGTRLDQLSSDADFKAEALRLLPQVAKQQAEEIWRITKKEFKLNLSQHSSLVKDLMRPYKNRCSPESRAMLARIEAALRKEIVSSSWHGTKRARFSKSAKGD